VELYRGGSTESRGRGMAWTTELAVARRFATESSIWDRTAIYRAELPPIAILAMTIDRAESEVVVNPNMCAQGSRSSRTSI
jgi:hypothetical protein